MSGNMLTMVYTYLCSWMFCGRDVRAELKIIQEIRRARDKVKGASEALENMSKQMDTLEISLMLVKDEKGLQTAVVAQQVESINDIAIGMKTFLEQLASEQNRKSVTKFFHALKSGDKEDKELAGILDRLDRARSDLHIRISVAQVGLVGDLQSGFRVAFDVLVETNKKVKEVLGFKLKLVDQLQDRLSHEPAGNMIPLGPSDVQKLGLIALSQASRPADGTANDAARETLIVYNITEGQARIIGGDIGESEWRSQARKTTVARNKFGPGLTLIVGDVRGKAAEDFNKSFWG